MMKSIKSMLWVIPLFALAILCGIGGEPAYAATMPQLDLQSEHLLLAAGSIVVTPETMKNIFTAFKTAFQNAFDGATSMYQRVATEMPSTTKEEKYAWLGQFPRFREWLGDRHVKGMKLHDHTIKNKKFETTIGVSRDDIEDDSYGVFTPMYGEMGYAARTHPDELVFALLAAGFAETCYDGQYFFDTDHPVGNDEDGFLSVSNMQAGAGAPWFLIDGKRPLKPIIFQKRRDYDFRSLTDLESEKLMMTDEFIFGVDARGNAGFGLWQLAFGSKATLDETNFDAAYAAMIGFKSDEGRPLGVVPNLLVCGSSNRAKANAVIEAMTKANGASNTNYKAVEVLVVPWLA